MKLNVLQELKSNIHQSAFFYHGVIAEFGEYRLETYQDGEILVDEGTHQKSYCGETTPNMFIEQDICDSDINLEKVVDIRVDKFFTITKNGKVVDEDLMEDNYSAAMMEFLMFLNKTTKENLMTCN